MSVSDSGCVQGEGCCLSCAPFIETDLELDVAEEERSCVVAARVSCAVGVVGLLRDTGCVW